MTNCSCGITGDADGEYIVLTADTKRALTDAEIQVIENWLRSESGLEQVRLYWNA